VCFLVNHYEDSEIINIGVGKDISISELADLIKDIVGFKGAIRYDRSKPDGTPENSWTRANSERSGGSPRSPSGKGLKELIDGMLKKVHGTSARCKAQGARNKCLKCLK